MIKRYNNLSFVFGVPGIVLRIVPAFYGTPAVRVTMFLAGTALLLVGLLYYAKAKARHPAWGLFGFLGIIGLIVLACLKDHAKEVVAVDEAPAEAEAPSPDA